jgi:hypothetical protein
VVDDLYIWVGMMISLFSNIRFMDSTAPGALFRESSTLLVPDEDTWNLLDTHCFISEIAVNASGRSFVKNLRELESQFSEKSLMLFTHVFTIASSFSEDVND